MKLYHKLLIILGMFITNSISLINYPPVISHIAHTSGNMAVNKNQLNIDLENKPILENNDFVGLGHGFSDSKLESHESVSLTSRYVKIIDLDESNINLTSLHSHTQNLKLSFNYAIRKRDNHCYKRDHTYLDLNAQYTRDLLVNGKYKSYTAKIIDVKLNDQQRFVSRLALKTENNAIFVKLLITTYFSNWYDYDFQINADNILFKLDVPKDRLLADYAQVFTKLDELIANDNLVRLEHENWEDNIISVIWTKYSAYFSVVESAYLQETTYIYDYDVLNNLLTIKIKWARGHHLVKSYQFKLQFSKDSKALKRANLDLKSRLHIGLDSGENIAFDKAQIYQSKELYIYYLPKDNSEIISVNNRPLVSNTNIFNFHIKNIYISNFEITIRINDKIIFRRNISINNASKLYSFFENESYKLDKELYLASFYDKKIIMQIVELPNLECGNKIIEQVKMQNITANIYESPKFILVNEIVSNDINYHYMLKTNDTNLNQELVNFYKTTEFKELKDFIQRENSDLEAANTKDITYYWNIFTNKNVKKSKIYEFNSLDFGEFVVAFDANPEELKNKIKSKVLQQLLKYNLFWQDDYEIFFSQKPLDQQINLLGYVADAAEYGNIHIPLTLVANRNSLKVNGKTTVLMLISTSTEIFDLSKLSKSIKINLVNDKISKDLIIDTVTNYFKTNYKLDVEYQFDFDFNLGTYESWDDYFQNLTDKKDGITLKALPSSSKLKGQIDVILGLENNHSFEESSALNVKKVSKSLTTPWILIIVICLLIIGMVMYITWRKLIKPRIRNKKTA